jgi:hypothetical protein
MPPGEVSHGKKRLRLSQEEGRDGFVPPGIAAVLPGRGIPLPGGVAMKTRENEIIKLTRGLKALGYDIEAMTLECCGKIDDPQYIEVELKIISFRDKEQD